MRRRHHVLTIAFAASMLAGCLGSIGTPGEPTGQDPAPAGSSSSGGSSGGNGATGATGGGDAPAAPAAPVQPTMPPAVQGTLAAALDKTSDSIRLNETKSYTLTLTPGGGMTGGVTLALDAPPAGVTAKFTPATVDIADATPITVKVDVNVASNMATPGSSVTLSVKAASGTIVGAASLGLMVPAELLVQIPNGVAIGTAASPNTTAFGSAAIPVIQVAAGTKITWVNLDGINHEIHSDGNLGIAHESGPLMANSANAYTQTFKGTGASGTVTKYKFRCHIHPNMLGEIDITNP